MWILMADSERMSMDFMTDMMNVVRSYSNNQQDARQTWSAVHLDVQIDPYTETLAYGSSGPAR